MVMTPMKTADDTERMLGTVMSLKGRKGGPVASRGTRHATHRNRQHSLAAHLHNGCSRTKPSLCSDVGDEQESIRDLSRGCYEHPNNGRDCQDLEPRGGGGGG